MRCFKNDALVAVNWTCGTANTKAYTYDITTYWSDTQCGNGTASNTAFPAQWGSASWTCSGTNGWSASVTCSASRASPPSLPFTQNCTANWEIIYTNASWTEIGRVNNVWTTISWTPWNLTCAWHIVMCTGISAWYILQACNLWATVVSITTNGTQWWNVYQWWRNKAFFGAIQTTALPKQATTIAWTIWLNATTDTYDFVWNASLSSPYTWANTDITDNWWHLTGTNLARKWPCNDGYHVPTQAEWTWTNNAWWFTNGTNFSTSLKLPYAGYRRRQSGSMTTYGSRWSYWSSSFFNSNAVYMNFYSAAVYPDRNYGHAYGMSVRCFKNDNSVPQ